jgi:hypothetical protein
MTLDPVIFTNREDLQAHVSEAIAKARRDEAGILSALADTYAERAMKEYASIEEQARLEGVSEGLRLAASLKQEVPA